MIIGVCVITHNRLVYTKRCLEALADGTPVVVDNASTDGTQEWLEDQPVGTVFNKRNLFPGAATNIGWAKIVVELDPDILVRIDNDIQVVRGWHREVREAFGAIPKLGLLGLLNQHEDFPDGYEYETYEENGYAINISNPRGVGGCVAMRRELWEEGFRWSPGAWAPGDCEDGILAKDIEEAGWLVGRVIPTIANNMSFHRYEDYPSYYDRTAQLRGLVPELSV